MKPFLRWAGGKRWLAPRLAPILLQRLTKSYFEPFLGAGALYFHLAPSNALLSDINRDLIISFKVAVQTPGLLLERLREIPVDADSYYRVRASNPRDHLSRAVRFIYLNRTSYGGIHRTNQKGEYNTPFGGGSRTAEPLWRDGLLYSAAQVLKTTDTTVTSSDFEPKVLQAGPGDVVYCDPVYATHDREMFDRYNSHLFKWEDQIRLRNAAYKAYSQGALVVISNCYCEAVRSLYPNAFRIILEKGRGASQTKQGIGAPGCEYLIVLDPQDRRKDWSVLGGIERRTRCTKRKHIATSRRSGHYESVA